MVKKGWAQVPKLNNGPPLYRLIFYTYTWQYNSMGNTLYVTKDGEKDKQLNYKFVLTSLAL